MYAVGFDFSQHVDSAADVTPSYPHCFFGLQPYLTPPTYPQGEPFASRMPMGLWHIQSNHRSGLVSNATVFVHTDNSQHETRHHVLQLLIYCHACIPRHWLGVIGQDIL